MSRPYFIYSHTSPSGKVYIGQTVNIKRRWGYNGEHYTTKKKDGSYVQAAFAKAIVKYGWNNFKHNIILDGISKSEADYAERYLIRWYKMHNMSYNISNGGEGCDIPRPPLTEEQKRKISEKLLANAPMKGKHHTPEALAKITEASRNRIYTAEQKATMAEKARKLNLGRKASEDTKQKLSQYRKAHPETWVAGWNRVEVHQYNLKGNYMASYSSAMEAALHIGKNIGSDISECAKGNVASAGGFVWRYKKVESIDMSKYKVLKTAHGSRLYDITKEGRYKRSVAHGKAVNQYSLDGKYIASYSSASEAAINHNFNRTGIMKCCKHLPKYKTANGFIWEYDTISNRVDMNMNHDNDEANTIEREKIAEEARQFDAKLKLEGKKVDIEQQKQKDDARLKEKQINKSVTKK